MKKRMGFKVVKIGIRGAFFSFYFTMRLLSRFIKYLNTIKHDALTDKGNCPSCKSMDIDYLKPTILEENVHIRFKCLKCGKHGKEVYALRYIKSLLKKEVSNGNGGTIQYIEEHSRPAC
jgi:Zn ribbon nucleic-acid-binding protein